MKRLMIVLAMLAAGPAIAQSNTVGVVGRPAPASAAQMCFRDAAGNCAVPSITSSGGLSAADANNASYTFGPAMTSGTAYPFATYKQRGILFNCTAAGSIDLTDANSTVQSIAVGVGLQYHPFAGIVSWAASSGSSPACSARLLL